VKFTLWLIAGAVVGVFNGLLLARSVDSVRPDSVGQSILVLIATGALRWIAAMVVIGGALRTDAIAGLAAAGGVLLAYRTSAFAASRTRRREQQSQ